MIRKAWQSIATAVRHAIELCEKIGLRLHGTKKLAPKEGEQ